MEDTQTNIFGYLRTRSPQPVGYTHATIERVREMIAKNDEAGRYVHPAMRRAVAQETAVSDAYAAYQQAASDLAQARLVAPHLAKDLQTKMRDAAVAYVNTQAKEQR